MTKSPPNPAEISATLAKAEEAVLNSRAVRARFARRRTSQRSPRLLAARERCAEAASPIRSWLGIVAWGVVELEDELAMKRSMERLRYERRQIDKML